MKEDRELNRSKKELKEGRKEGREGGREGGKEERLKKVGKKGRMAMFLNFVILRP